MDLTIDQRRSGSWDIVSVAGEIDLLTAPVLKERLIDAIEGGSKQVMLDLSAVSFIDSSGLGALIAGHKRLREKEGAMILVATARAVLSVLSLTGLDKVFQVYPSVDEALEGARA